MRSFFLVCLCVLTLAVAVPAQAATITWGAPVLTDWNPTQVDTTGSPFAAITSYSTNLTINGVTFNGAPSAAGDVWSFGSSPITMTYVTGGSVSVPYAGMGYDSSTDYRKLIRGNISYAGSSASVGISGLTPSNTYQVQLWASTWDTAFVLYLDGSNAVPMGADHNWYEPHNTAPHYRIGTFVADATTQSIGITSSAYLFTPGAISVRDLTVIPEPSTLILLGTGLLGLLAYAWRRRRA